jgi:hypothetical protein
VGDLDQAVITAKKYDVIVLCIGEPPYAEGKHLNFL